MPLGLDEQCSCISWVGGDETALAIVYTKSMIDHLTRLCREYEGFERLDKYPDGAVVFRFPVRYLKLRLPFKQRRAPVEEPDLTGLPLDERELNVTWDEYTQTAYVYTTESKWARKLVRQGVPWVLDPPGVSFMIPKAAVKVYAPRIYAPRSGGARSTRCGPHPSGFRAPARGPQEVRAPGGGVLYQDCHGEGLGHDQPHKAYRPCGVADLPVLRGGGGS